MVDVPSAQVQVLPVRLASAKKRSIKKQIRKLDCRIQEIQADMARCKANLSYLSPDYAERWVKHLEKITSDRAKLDSRRRNLRAKLKGYSARSSHLP